ncbi:MAG: DUF6970 domain-containing protein, partial [Flavobacteriales bacterium]
MKFKILLFASAVAVTSCNQDDNAECVDDRIANFGNEICEEGATVKKYSFQENTVYVIHPGNCVVDGADEVIDSDCETLGYVGGFGGATDINGENF